MPRARSESTGVPEYNRSSACAKAILAGEHAVVYGAPAIAVPILSMDIQLSFSREVLTSQQRDLIFMEASQLARSEDARALQWEPEMIRELKDEAFQVLKTYAWEVSKIEIEAFPFEIKGHSKLLPGAGLGASAALSVALIQGLSLLAAYPLSQAELAGLANQLERRFHGNPSGLDTAVISHRQAIHFERGRGSRLLSIAPILEGECSFSTWPFALIDTRTRSSTLKMVEQAVPYFLPGGRRDEALIAAFTSVVQSIEFGLSSGDLSLVKEGLQDCSELLVRIGVIPDTLRDALSLANDCGVLASKSTGAGGGGCLLALLPPHDLEATLTELRFQFGQDCIYPMSIPSTIQAQLTLDSDGSFTPEKKSYAII